MFVDIFLSELHILIRTYRGTHTQAHMYDQNTRGMAVTRHRSRSLVGRGGRKVFVRDKGLEKKSKCQHGGIKATSINVYTTRVHSARDQGFKEHLRPAASLSPSCAEITVHAILGPVSVDQKERTRKGKFGPKRGGINCKDSD